MNRLLAIAALVVGVGCNPTPVPDGAESFCGDGIVDQGEACDDGVNDGSYGGCNASCGARAAYCGDGTVSDGETCDDGVNDGSWGGCGYDCKTDGGTCGDGIVSGPELCDDGVNDGSYNGCGEGCRQYAAFCGDGMINGPEGCDDGINDDVCGSCTSDCLYDAVGTFLTQVVVRETGSDEELTEWDLDLYVVILDENGNLLAETAYVDDTNAPVVFDLVDPIPVEGEMLTIEVWDADSGAFGDDDDMGSVVADTSILSGSERDGDLRVEWTVDERTCP